MTNIRNYLSHDAQIQSVITKSKLMLHGTSVQKNGGPPL